MISVPQVIYYLSQFYWITISPSPQMREEGVNNCSKIALLIHIRKHTWLIFSLSETIRLLIRS